MATPTVPDANKTPSSVRTMASRRLHALRSLRFALVAAALCAMALLWLIDHSFRQLVNINTERQDIQVVRSTVDALLNNLTIAESSQRGFLLTDSKADLTIFDRTGKRVDDLLAQLDRKLAHTPMPAALATDFKTRLNEQMKQLHVAVDLYRDGRKEAATFAITSVAVEGQMQDVRDSGIKLMSRADALLADRQVAFKRLINYSRLAFLACVLAVLFGFVLYTQQRYRLRDADLQRQRQLQTERDRLESQVRERTQELNELATYLQRAVELERERLARELHDELGALMTTAKLDVARMRSRMPAGANELTERLAHLKSTLNEAIALKRRIMKDLYPSALRNLGLVPALEILTREFEQRSGISVNTDLNPVTLDADTQLTVYRMVQEALTNIAKHAGAGQVQVTVAEDAEAIRVMVSDDGSGFDPDARRHGRHGLAGMRHRLHSCGGQLHIASAAGQGTRVTARIPVEHA